MWEYYHEISYNSYSKNVENTTKFYLLLYSTWSIGKWLHANKSLIKKSHQNSNMH